MIVTLSPSCISSGGEDIPPIVDGSKITYRELTTELAGLAEGEFVHIGEDKHGAATRKDGKLVVILNYKYLFSTSERFQPVEESHYTTEISEGQMPCPIIRREVLAETEA